MKWDPYLTSYTQINSKRAEDLNIKARTTKLSEEYTGINRHNPEFGNGFSEAKAVSSNNKINKLDPIKIINICASKDSIKKVERQLTEREKISDKWKVSRIWKELLQLNKKKTTN